MLYSMTGFGRASAEASGRSANVQLRTVNHRGLDVRCNLPGALAALEVELLRRVRAAAGRGRVEVRVDVEGIATQTPSLDSEAAVAVHRRLDAVRAQLGLDSPVTLSDVLRAPGLWSTHEREVPGEVHDLVLEALDEALMRLDASRQREGQALLSDFQARHARLVALLDEARARAPQRLDEYRQRLESRLDDLRSSDSMVAELAEMAPSRLAMEVALLADRADVDEELNRASAHLDELARLLSSPCSATDRRGKRLDFFLQELGREVNTMASKSRDTALTRLTIEMKSQLESMREQAANVQ